MLDRARLWARSIVMRRRLEREMQEEMAEHLRQATSRLMTRGLPEKDARQEALREFGNVGHLQEQGRDARGAGWLDALWGDLRFALRHFARRPGTIVVMFVVLAAGMSISTLLFSYVHSYAVETPKGVAFQEDLVRIRGSRTAGAGGRGHRPFSEDEFLEYRKLTDHFRAVAGWTEAMVPLVIGDDAERRTRAARIHFVTENYFSVLGLQPALGAGLPALASDERSTGAVAVIGHEAWEQLFASSPDVIGSTLQVNGVPVTVVGVAPEDFIGLTGWVRIQLWMPLSTQHMLLAGEAGPSRAFALLRPGVSTEAATSAVQAIAAGTAEEVAALRPLDPSSEVVPLRAGNEDPMFERDVRLLSVAVGFLGLLVLLVTCTNVSALLTGLATARRQEIAIRLSLGAARTRLIRQLLTESALLACAAGAAALGIVSLVLEAISTLLPVLPLEVQITWQVTTFTFGIALLVGVVFGLSPALHATRLALATALRDSTGVIATTRARLQRGLVVAQIAFTQPLVVLLSVVLLLVLGAYQRQGRTGHADHLVAVSLSDASGLSGTSPAAPGSRQQLRATMNRVLERLETVPGVQEAVIDWRFESRLGSYVEHPDDRVADAVQPPVGLTGEMAGRDWLSVMGMPLVRGREFLPTEVSSLERRSSETAAIVGAEVPVMIGADLARRLWAGADPLGRRLRMASDTATGARTLVVVGVFDDPRAATRIAGDDYRILLPPDTTRVPRALLLRTAGLAQPLIPLLRQVVQEEAPDMVAYLRSVADIEAESRRNFRLVTGGILAAGLAALFLSAIGLYAVVAFSVAQRTREIAVRMAVGALSRQITRKFVADGVRLSIFGLVIGLPASLVGLRILTSISGVPSVPLPPATAITAGGVMLVAAAAAWIPARRAAAVDPAVTLRSD